VFRVHHSHAQPTSDGTSRLVSCRIDDDGKHLLSSLSHRRDPYQVDCACLEGVISSMISSANMARKVRMLRVKLCRPPSISKCTVYIGEYVCLLNFSWCTSFVGAIVTAQQPLVVYIDSKSCKASDLSPMDLKLLHFIGPLINKLGLTVGTVNESFLDELAAKIPQITCVESIVVSVDEILEHQIVHFRRLREWCLGCLASVVTPPESQKALASNIATLIQSEGLIARSQGSQSIQSQATNPRCYLGKLSRDHGT